jgi:hypothetical protein
VIANEELKGNLHGSGAAVGRAMKYRLNIIAIRIKKEGGVVPRMIVAQAWWSIIRPAIFETVFVEALRPWRDLRPETPNGDAP